MYQNPIEHLSHHEGTKQLIHTVETLQKILRTIKAHVPANLAQQVGIIKLENELLTLSLPSAHFVQRLKSVYPVILETLQQQNICVKNIQLKILPASGIPVKVSPKPNTGNRGLSESGIEAFKTLESQTEHHPELHHAIQRLLSRRQ